MFSSIPLFCVAGLLMLMQGGFTLITTGLCRARNAGQIAMANLLIAVSSMISFWILGYAIMFGGRLFHVVDPATADATHPFLTMALLASIAAVIPAGAMAERWTLRNIAWYGFWAGAIPVALYGRWVWRTTGWLADLGPSCGMGHGVVDFAGASVVHMTGGVMALVGCSILGARVGKYSRDGRPRPMPGHNLVFVVFGTLLLFGCWFGFNSARPVAVDRLEILAVNTLMAGVLGGFAAYLATVFKFGKPDPSMTCNGVLAGLVAISAGCPFVNTIAAALIGIVAGIVVVHAVLFFEGRLKLDDPVGAISVHAVGGAWGMLSVGLFANGSFGSGLNGVQTANDPGVSGALGRMFGGPVNDWSQLAAQLVGVVTCVLSAGILGWVWFKLSNKFAPMRPRRDFEMGGLDLPETGAECYPDFHLTDKSAGGPMQQ